MEKIKIFIQLTRLNKPIGFLLLFWPCAWGLSLGYYFEGETNLYLKCMRLDKERFMELSLEMDTERMKNLITS